MRESSAETIGKSVFIPREASAACVLDSERRLQSNILHVFTVLAIDLRIYQGKHHPKIGLPLSLVMFSFLAQGEVMCL